VVFCGGSATIHDAFHEGRRVRITTPRNAFALHPTAPRAVLIAGGIGVTPLIAMAHELRRRGADFQLHYCAHNRATAPFLAELEAGPFGDVVQTYLSGDPSSRRFDAARVLADAGDAHIYVCGPSRLQDGVSLAAEQLGLAPARVHRERFTADVDRRGEPFTVVAERSGITAVVPPGRSIAQVLTEQGVAVQVSCEQGVCGTCVTRVLAGEVDHRDLFLSEAERASNSRITVCCSRAGAGGTLVLDI